MLQAEQLCGTLEAELENHPAAMRGAIKLATQGVREILDQLQEAFEEDELGLHSEEVAGHFWKLMTLIESISDHRQRTDPSWTHEKLVRTASALNVLLPFKRPAQHARE